MLRHIFAINCTCILPTAKALFIITATLYEHHNDNNCFKKKMWEMVAGGVKIKQRHACARACVCVCVCVCLGLLSYYTVVFQLKHIDLPSNGL